MHIMLSSSKISGAEVRHSEMRVKKCSPITRLFNPVQCFVILHKSKGRFLGESEGDQGGGRG